MCHDPDSVPPVYGDPRTSVRDAGPLILTSADATVFAAYSALPSRVRGAGVLVLPDNRGLSGFYEALCVRLAEQGHPAVAIDYYGRTAGTASRDADFPFMEHLLKTTRDTLYADIEAGLSLLPGKACTLGFCFGGRLAFLSASARFDVAGVVGFYGFPDELFGTPGPTQLAGSFTAPVLGLFGGTDEGIPPQTIAAFEQALASAGVQRELVVYPGMPHSFFDIPAGGDTEADDSRDLACADAWQRVLAFLQVVSDFVGDTPGGPHLP